MCRALGAANTVSFPACHREKAVPDQYRLHECSLWPSLEPSSAVERPMSLRVTPIVTCGDHCAALMLLQCLVIDLERPTRIKPVIIKPSRSPSDNWWCLLYKLELAVVICFHYVNSYGYTLYVFTANGFFFLKVSWWTSYSAYVQLPSVQSIPLPSSKDFQPKALCTWSVSSRQSDQCALGNSDFLHEEWPCDPHQTSGCDDKRCCGPVWAQSELKGNGCLNDLCIWFWSTQVVSSAKSIPLPRTV